MEWIVRFSVLYLTLLVLLINRFFKESILTTLFIFKGYYSVHVTNPYHVTKFWKEGTYFFIAWILPSIRYKLIPRQQIVKRVYLFSIAGILLRIRYKLIPRQQIVKRGYLFFHCGDTTQYTLQTHTTSRNCRKSVLIFLCRDTTQYTLQTHTTSRNCKKRVLIFSLPGHYPVYVANWNTS